MCAGVCVEMKEGKKKQSSNFPLFAECMLHERILDSCAVIDGALCPSTWKHGD